MPFSDDVVVVGPYIYMYVCVCLFPLMGLILGIMSPR